MIVLDEKAVEAAAIASYEYEGDRKGIAYVGWQSESALTCSQWRASVRVAIAAYLAALPTESAS